MSLPDLAAVLWRQRELLERLTYRLVCEQLLLAAGRTRWLPAATGEVESLTAELAVVELQRAAIADTAARQLGLPRDAGMEDMAAAASPPWTEVLLEHREALLALTRELAATAEATRRLTAAGLASVEATMRARGYDARGNAGLAVAAGPIRVDRAL